MDHTVARKYYNDFEICVSGQATGKCITSNSKAVLQKCIVRSNDLCVCLVNFNLNYKDIKKTVVLDWNEEQQYETALTKIIDWNLNKVLPHVNNPVEFFDCKLVMSELNCMSFYGEPCFVTVDGDILVWIGSNAPKQFRFETLSVKKADGFAANFLAIEGTVAEGSNILLNPAKDVKPFG